jgi:hypothetical protein
MGRQSFGSGRSDGADFVAEGIHVGRDERLLPGEGVEVAVGAAVEAKGDVEVEGVFRCHVLRCQVSSVTYDDISAGMSNE